MSPSAPTEKLLLPCAIDSIFSLPSPSNTNPTPAGRTTSVPVKLILFPEIVKSVPLPSIFSPASPNTTPTLGTTTSVGS